MGTAFVVSGAGRITAIKQEWLYDNLLSDGMLAALREEGGGTADLQAYAVETIGNLEPFGYFMQLRAGGKAVPVGPVREFTGTVEDGVIVLRFTAPLARPVDPRQETVALKVYDPTYFIEMLQNPDKPPHLAGPGHPQCEIAIVDPDPSDADYARALALDRGDKAEPDFGDLFAQQIRLECQ